jgi:hypothetical protein
MSDKPVEHKTPHSKVPVIERNGVDKTLSLDVFSKKSDHAGKAYYRPVFAETTSAEDIQWAGLSWILAIANKASGLIFRDLFIEAHDKDTGAFNEQKWLDEAKEFTEGVQTLSDIEDAIEELSAQQSALAQDPDFNLEEGESVSPRAGEIMAQMKEISGKLRPLRAEKAKIKEKYAQRLAAKKAKQEASPTRQAVTA